MNYQELNDLYIRHVQENNDWLGSLLKASIELRNQISTQLGEPEPWTNQQSQRVPYINLSTLQDDSGNFKRLSPSDVYADEEGVFAFTISLTFEKAPRSFPKELYWLAIGTKSVNHEIHYTIWDTLKGHPQDKATWVKGVEAAADMVIARFVEYLSFDPETDLSNRPSIGFV